MGSISSDLKPAIPERSASTAVLFWMVLGVPIVAAVLVFPILCSRFFQRYCDAFSITNQEVIYTTQNRRCDVLIFGDSTSLVGLDPEIIAKETDLVTCNMALTAGSFGVLGMEPLDRFLARNPRPQFLVFGYSPANFSSPATHARENALDGMVMVVRHFGWIRGVKDIVEAPDRLQSLMSYTYLQGAMRLPSLMRWHPPAFQSERVGTYSPLALGPLTTCEPFSGSRIPPDPAWIAWIRTHYAGAATYVLIDVAPTSTCIDMYEKWTNSLAHLTDNQLNAYPVNLFADSFYHLTRAGSIQYSLEIAQQISRFAPPSSAGAQLAQVRNSGSVQSDRPNDHLSKIR